VLREELLARGAASAVLAAGLRAVGVIYEYQLTVRVLACEGGADGGVYFRAAWELSTADAAPRVVANGDFTATGLKWDGKSGAALAAQLSESGSQRSRSKLPPGWRRRKVGRVFFVRLRVFLGYPKGTARNGIA